MACAIQQQTLAMIPTDELEEELRIRVANPADRTALQGLFQLPSGREEPPPRLAAAPSVSRQLQDDPHLNEEWIVLRAIC